MSERQKLRMIESNYNLLLAIFNAQGKSAYFEALMNKFSFQKPKAIEPSSPFETNRLQSISHYKDDLIMQLPLCIFSDTKLAFRILWELEAIKQACF